MLISQPGGLVLIRNGGGSGRDKPIGLECLELHRIGTEFSREIDELVRQFRRSVVVDPCLRNDEDLIRQISHSVAREARTAACGRMLA